ncbi:MAG: hypothetical protein GY805_12600 [Chloroflexi bacterium]|nr:hypothetical protein [Chloroflexota bacterium]
MTQQINLKEVERKAFRASFQDGMSDVMLGSVLAVMSLVPWLESLGVKRPFYYLIAFAILVLVWAEKKIITKRFIIPRLGKVTFSPERKNRIKWARVAMSIMVAVTIGLVILTATGALQGSARASSPWSGYLFIGAVFVITLSLLAFFLDYPRLYFYGWFLTLMYPFSEWLEAETGWIFPSGDTFFGVFIVFIGIATYIHFLRQHPLLPQDESTTGGHDGQSS